MFHGDRAAAYGNLRKELRFRIVGLNFGIDARIRVGFAFGLRIQIIAIGGLDQFRPAFLILIQPVSQVDIRPILGISLLIRLKNRIRIQQDSRIWIRPVFRIMIVVGHDKPIWLIFRQILNAPAVIRFTIRFPYKYKVYS